MDIKKIKKLFAQMIDLCLESQDPELVSKAEKIFEPVEFSGSIPKITNALNKLMEIISSSNIDKDGITKLHDELMELINCFE